MMSLRVAYLISDWAFIILGLEFIARIVGAEFHADTKASCDSKILLAKFANTLDLEEPAADGAKDEDASEDDGAASEGVSEADQAPSTATLFRMSQSFALGTVTATAKKRTTARIAVFQSSSRRDSSACFLDPG
ncbi:hypothetical protein VPNG_10179 [Cytospora leucostoma]|uniref:Uncharacterized protein n=1 Tax=Cytospora leucostoma TaxID=1230097 RepID=A0A423VFL2_9PEZI|nr:hypothetical protein VPNG_10179 [Cytospora leucostoma]